MEMEKEKKIEKGVRKVVGDERGKRRESTK